MAKFSPPLLIPALILGVLFVGCSTPSPQPPDPNIVVVTEPVRDTKTVKPPKKVRSKPTAKPRPKAPTKPQVKVAPTNPAPESLAETPAVQAPTTPEVPATTTPIATFVTAGQLESATSGQLVFASNNAVAQEDQGLFEDAILLSRVRAGLAAVAEPNLASTAKVSSGTVTLDVPASSEPKAVAAAVDTALNTNGVRKVQVNMTSN